MSTTLAAAAAHELVVKHSRFLANAMPVEDVDAAAAFIARVSVLADDHPELASVRLNPVMAHQDGIEVLGAQVRVAPAPTRTDAERRAMLS